METLMIKIQDQHGDLFRIKMEIDDLGFVHRLQKTKYPQGVKPEMVNIHPILFPKPAEPQPQDPGVFDDVAADKLSTESQPKPQDQDLNAIVNAIQRDLAKNRKKRRQREKRAYRKFLLSELFFGCR